MSNLTPLSTGGKRSGRNLPFAKLLEISTMQPDDALLELIRSKEALQNTIARPDLRSDWVKLLTRIFSVILNSTLKQNIFDIMSLLPGSNFIRFRLLTVIQELRALSLQGIATDHNQFINDILALFERFNSAFPSSVSDLPIDNLLAVISKLDFEEKEEALAKVGELINQRDDLIAEKLSEVNTAKKRAIYKVQGPPPEDFRELSVVPTIHDIDTDKEPYLRPIKTIGKYENGEEYLDVQFRLLKEDFTAPLREGIEEITKGLSRFERKHDMKIYRDVHILYPSCTNAGITHTITFDVSRLQNVPWQHSRRLIFGSLLCFSADKFKTCFFAKVSHRDVKELVKGRINVRFINGLDDIINTTANDVYLMAESPSYFEAYCHVLEALKEMSGETLPFFDYIVSATAIAQPPKYIRETFDTAQYNLSGCITEKGVSCKTTLRNIETWEEKGVMNQSQLAAVKKALSREFVIIQGPPGTGKTFVALRITHALLSNQGLWSAQRFRYGQMNSNILLVCYTNHALDQFVEGLLEMNHTSIVRVGSRCTSKAVDSYSFKRNREKNFDDFESQRIVSAIGKATKERYELIDKLHSVAESLEIIETSCYSGKILYVNRLRSYMPHHLWTWFSNMNENTMQQKIPFLEMFLGLYPFLPWLTQNLNTETNKLRLRAEEQILNEQIQRRNNRALQGYDDYDIDDDVEFVDIEGDAEALVDRWAIGQENYAPLPVAQGLWEEIDMDDNTRVELEDEDGFITVLPSKRERQNQAKRQFQQAEAMTKEQVMSIRDPMALTMQQRWSFYKYLVNQYRERAKERLIPISKEYDECCKKIKELDEMKDELYLKESEVIAMTTTCAARYRKALGRIKPKIIIIEEAAEVLEAHVITSLTEGAEHVILIGDHKQLKPKPTVYKLAKEYNLELSLFERMIRNGMDCHCLDTQHRMRPEIAGLLQDIYPNLQNHPSVLKYPDIKGVSSNLFFVSHKHQEKDNSELKSKLNEFEAEYVVSLCWYLLLQGYSPSQITILTLYTGQLLLLKNLMPQKKFEGVRVTAVDNYQGEENDIILLSLVRNNDEDKIGFVGIENRICVSLSRAKHGLFVIGNMEFMAKRSATWKRIITRATAKNQVGPSLRLFCRNHPKTYIDAKEGADFNAAPEGGCKIQCDYRMDCGHVCQKACHPFDQEHLKVKCEKKCEKMICESHHRCIKTCHYGFECGPCKVLVPKVIPLCTHEQQVPCYQDPETFDCLFMVEKSLRCGHKTSIPCHKKDREDLSCSVECGELLECGHICNGTCSKCHQGRLHVQCSKTCERPLVCGHICKQSCSAECPPCKRVCQIECEHSKCKKACGEPCAPCREGCLWQCPHKKCTMLCSELCDRDPCNEPCPRLLPCDHPCIGFCGEKCPSLCRICDKEKVEEIFFGFEDDEDARFVELLDCYHVFESQGLDKWMCLDLNEDETKSINVKQCPKCKTPIKKSRRYGNEIKKTLLDVEKVKTLVISNQKRDFGILKSKKFKVLKHFMECSKLDRVKDRHTGVRMMHVLESLVPIIRLSRGQPLTNRLSSHSLQLIPTISENQLLCLERLDKLIRASAVEKEPDLKIYFTCFEEVLKWCFQESTSLQQTKEVDVELKRLSLYNSVVDVLCKMSAEDVGKNSQLSEYLQLLRSGIRLDHEKIKAMHSEVNAIRKKYSMGTLTAEEKQMIIRTMGLRAGHWYKCPKGHVYAIGDCGGAMQESRCPECNATIGGRNHSLAQGNAHAGEFDGSRHAAWSEGANLANFDPDEFANLF